MTAKDTPQDNNDEDMSIDELSAAIDAHMDEIATRPKLMEKPASKTIVENEPASTIKKQEQSKEVAGDIKIVTRNAYVKKDEKTSIASPGKGESQTMLVSNTKLKPIGESANDTVKVMPKPTARSIVDVVVRPPLKTKESKKIQDQPMTEELQLKQREPAKEEAEAAPKKKLEPEKPVIKTLPSNPVLAEQSPGNTDELEAQIPNAKSTEGTIGASGGEALKTFDTKQYHVPIKISHHHRQSGSIKVFIAVLVVILATAYVLSELEIIDLASLVALS